MFAHENHNKYPFLNQSICKSMSNWKEITNSSSWIMDSIGFCIDWIWFDSEMKKFFIPLNKNKISVKRRKYIETKMHIISWWHTQKKNCHSPLFWQSVRYFHYSICNKTICNICITIENWKCKITVNRNTIAHKHTHAAKTI